MSTINSGLLDPFVGFTFNGIHSSNYNIVRTNNSSRFEENLSPQSKDIVTEVPDMDGQLYWGTVYTKREFNVSFAFMELSEEKLALMKAAWDDRQIHDLVFDEQPDRIWSAKMTGQAQIKHLCFEKDGIRYYNGEGTFVFTCYYPFSRSLLKTKNGVNNDNTCELEVVYNGEAPANYVLKLYLALKTRSYTLKINGVDYTITGKKIPGQGETHITIDTNKGIFYGGVETSNIFFVNKELPLLSKEVGTFSFSTARNKIQGISIEYYEHYK